MAEMIAHIDQGVIGPVKRLNCFCISQLESAMMSFSKGVHTGKFIITFHNPAAILKVRIPNPPSIFLTVVLIEQRLRDRRFGPDSIQTQSTYWLAAWEGSGAA